MGDHASSLEPRNVCTIPMESLMTVPACFVSYTWEPLEHKLWVREFATRLRRDGVDVKLDQWETVPGDALPEFMERSVREHNFVLIVCTPAYRARSDRRIGGVGYEGDIITGSLMSSRNQRKFIPALREGQWTQAAPTWLGGKYYVDLRGDPYSEEQYQDLLSTMLGTREKAPPVGRAQPGAIPGEGRQAPAELEEFEPIRIIGVAVDEVGTPRSDGTRGSALYAVPFKLSRIVPPGWAELFIEAWDRPPSFTTMHRPGIARVSGNRIVLDGTTIEEVEQVHRPTLKLALAQANARMRERMETETRRRQEAAARKEDHEKHVKNVASRLKFDDN